MTLQIITFIIINLLSLTAFSETCGDGTCQTGETCTSCPSDCAYNAGYLPMAVQGGTYQIELANGTTIVSTAVGNYGVASYTCGGERPTGFKANDGSNSYVGGYTQRTEGNNCTGQPTGEWKDTCPTANGTLLIESYAKANATDTQACAPNTCCSFRGFAFVDCNQLCIASGRASGGACLRYPGGTVMGRCVCL